MILREDGGEKKKKLFTRKGSVRIAKNCDIGLEKAALGLRPRAAISRPRSQFFPIRTSQLANKIYFDNWVQITVFIFSWYGFVWHGHPQGTRVLLKVFSSVEI